MTGPAAAVLAELEAARSVERRMVRKSGRDERLALKRVAGRVSKSRAVRDCLGAAKVLDGQLQLVLGHVGEGDDGHGIGGFSQVMRCGLSNLCPWCAGKVREERAKRINDTVSPWLAAGGRVAFVVYTIASKPNEPIWATKKAVTQVMTKFRQLLRRDGFLDRAGVLGTISGWEFTVRLDGSGHPHRNELILFRNPYGVEELMFRVPQLWVEAARSCGRRASLDHGMRVQFPELDEDGGIRVISEYASKGPEGWGAGQELCRADKKTSRDEDTYAPFDLLRIIHTDGDVSDHAPAVKAWKAYERACKGTAVARFSRGLEQRLEHVARTGQIYDVGGGVDELSEDADEASETLTVAEEEALVEEAPMHAPPVVAFGRRAWRFVHLHGLQALILRVLEDLYDTGKADGEPVDYVASIRYLLASEGATDDEVAEVIDPPSELTRGPFDD